MKKFKLHRLAMLIPMLAGSAMAEPTLYGKANVSFESVDENGASTTEVVSNASRIGVKGSEDLDGLKAIYQFEFQVDVADGDNSGETFSQRNIFVGLQGSAGTVKLGKFDTPLKTAQNKIDLFNDLRGDIKNLITPNDNRPSNVVSYTSPKAPVQVTVAYVNSEDEDVDSGISASVTFTQDNLYLALAVDQDVEGEGSDAVRAVAQYNLDNLQLGALVEEYDAGAGAESAFVLSAQYKVNSWAWKAQFASSDETLPGASVVSLGADYKYSKAIKVFGFLTTYASDDIELDDVVLAEGEDSTYLGLGMEYKF